MASAAAIAVLRPVQVGGLSAGAVVGDAALGVAVGAEAGGAAYGMVWVWAHGSSVVSSVRGVVIGVSERRWVKVIDSETRPVGCGDPVCRVSKD